MQEVNHYFVSAAEYAEQTGIGEVEVKKQLRTGFLEGFITEGGHYKIKVYKDGSVPYKQYGAVVKENAELKIKLEAAKNILA